MRLLLLAVVAIMPVVPVVAAAQPAAARAGAVPVLPTLGLPLPSIGIPHPPTGLPQPDVAGGPKPGGRDGKAGRPHRRHAPQAFPFVFYPFLFVPPPPTAPRGPGDAVSSGTSSEASVSTQVGRITLAVVPPTAQLYVDGAYVGTPDDYPDGIELTAEPHVLDVRAPGYASVATSVRLAPGRVITYRATLVPVVPPVEPQAPQASSGPAATTNAAQPTSPSTFYAIPGCYLGNVAPEPAHLPAGCDPARAVVFQP
ncbi:MAG: PEGA domain-containing protein [Vicinamibacterales bacterium]